MMQNIDVSDLPEPVAVAIAAMVEALRQQLAKDQAVAPTQGPVTLSVVDGAVIGNLTREEISGDRF